MHYEVLVTDDAARDLEELWAWVAEHDSPAKARRLCERIESVILGLEKLPQRGVWPKELSALGIRRYRQTGFKPYRIIYRVEGRRVFVMAVIDGRRDLQTLLVRRLLSA